MGYSAKAMVSSWSLLERYQVRDEVLQLLRRQLHVRHKVPRLEMLRVLHPGLEVLGCVVQHASAERVTAHQMRQVRAKRAVGHRLAHRVTVHTGGSLEQVTAGLHGWVAYRWLLLRCHPAFEVTSRVYNDAEEHVGMFRPSVLGALTKIGSRS